MLIPYCIHMLQLRLVAFYNSDCKVLLNAMASSEDWSTNVRSCDGDSVISVMGVLWKSNSAKFTSVPLFLAFLKIVFIV